MTQKLLTHKDLAKILEVSETTVKSYRRKFPGCIPVANEGKPIRFTPQAETVARRIRDLFALGMAVQAIRQRLAEEFDWISPEASDVRPEQEPAKQAAGPDMAANVSNLAKSMVHMAQQQKAVLQRMQHIEAMLQEVGLQGGETALQETKQRKEAAELERDRRLEDRLNHLDGTTSRLSKSVESLTDRLEGLLGRREQAEKSWDEQAQQETSAVSAAVKEAVMGQPAGKKGDNVIPMYPSEPAQQESPASPSRSSVEPPREFLSLPLVVCTAQGQYTNAGGRGRGRFCLNDLKATLVYGFAPPHHFSMRWEQHGKGWWLFLDQPGIGQTHVLDLLLMEAPTQRGETVVDILQLKHKGENVHPAAIGAILDSWTG